MRFNEFRLTYAAVVGNNPIGNDQIPSVSSTVVSEDECSTDALVKPLRFRCIIETKTDEGSDWILVLRPECPSLYVSLSDVAIQVNEEGFCTGDNTDKIDSEFRCVRETLTVAIERTEIPFSRARGPRTDSFLLFRPVERMDSFRVGTGENLPDRIQYKLSNVPRPLFRDLNVVQTLRNPSALQQTMRFSIQKGFEDAKSREITEANETKAEVAIMASGGVEGVADFEVTSTFGKAWSTSSSVSTSEVLTTVQTSEVEITVPPFSEAQLSQLIIGDSQFGRGQATLSVFTSYFALKIFTIDGITQNNTGDTASDNSATVANSNLLNSVALLQNVTSRLLATVESILIDQTERDNILMNLVGLQQKIDTLSVRLSEDANATLRAVNESTSDILFMIEQGRGKGSSDKGKRSALRDHTTSTLSVLHEP